MKPLRICLLQVSIKPCQVKHNIRICIEYLRKAKSEYNPDVAVFPETVTTGFNTNLSKTQIFNLVDKIPGETTREIQDMSKKLKMYVLWTTYERGENKNVYNTSVLISPDGDIVAKYRKLHPFPTERKWTTPGKDVIVAKTNAANFGLSICYDGDFPELYRRLKLMGAEIVFRPSAFLRDYDIWSLTNRARAYDNQVYIIAVNACGRDAKFYYYGHSMVVDPYGRIIAQASANETILCVDLKPIEDIKPPWAVNIDHIRDLNRIFRR